MAAQNSPDIKIDLFKSDATAEELARIDRVNIFKTKGTESTPSVILCMPTVNGEKLKAREISPQQWQRMWLAEDMQDYKKHLAASLFADVLRKDRTDAVAVGTDKSEQETQSKIQISKRKYMRNRPKRRADRVNLMGHPNLRAIRARMKVLRLKQK